MKSILALLSITALLGGDSSASAQQPNVIVMLTDDQGTLDAQCYGSTDLLTPNAEPNPEVKDHYQEQPEIVMELLTLHKVWEKDVKAN